jgi:hypothetical protein
MAAFPPPEREEVEENWLLFLLFRLLLDDAALDLEEEDFDLEEEDLTFCGGRGEVKEERL